MANVTTRIDRGRGDGPPLGGWYHLLGRTMEHPDVELGADRYALIEAERRELQRVHAAPCPLDRPWQH